LASGKVVRSAVSGVPAKGRDTMGVVFARFAEEDSVIGLAKNTERNLESATEAQDATVDESTETVSSETDAEASDGGASE
jgi:DNA gyrase subunit A